MNRATTRVTAQLSREFPELSDTLIDNALTVSQGGYAKARSLLAVAKGKAAATLAQADAAGSTIPVQLTPELAESLKTALLKKAVDAGQIPPSPAGQPVSSALERLPAPLRTMFERISTAADGSVPLTLKPSEADLFKTQLQKEVRQPIYLNRIAANGPKAVAQDATVMADYAKQLNDAIEGMAAGYQAANREAQPLIGAVRGLKQAIRPSGNLYQAMVRPALGATLGGITGQYEYGTPGAAVGSILGAAATSPVNLSREAIVLAHPAVQTALRQMPKPFADAVRTALTQALTGPPTETSPSEATRSTR
jgi:hypothetical protein